MKKLLLLSLLFAPFLQASQGSILEYNTQKEYNPALIEVMATLALLEGPSLVSTEMKNKRQHLTSKLEDASFFKLEYTLAVEYFAKEGGWDFLDQQAKRHFESVAKELAELESAPEEDDQYGSRQRMIGKLKCEQYLAPQQVRSRSSSSYPESKARLSETIFIFPHRNAFGETEPCAFDRVVLAWDGVHVSQHTGIDDQPILSVGPSYDNGPYSVDAHMFGGYDPHILSIIRDRTRYQESPLGDKLPPEALWIYERSLRMKIEQERKREAELKEEEEQ